MGIQTDIIDGCDGPVKIPNRKRYRDVECTTPLKTFEDKLVGPNISITEENVSQYFSGNAQCLHVFIQSTVTPGLF